MGQDTVFVYGSHKINFSFKSSDQAIQGAKLLVDNHVVDSAFSSSGFFNLNSYDIQGNESKLTLQLFTKTGTGSIADKLDAESFIFSNDWVLIIDRNTNDNTTYKVDDGVLRYIIEPYKALDFDSYVINRYWNLTDAIYTKDLSYLDYSYVGEGADIDIFVKRKDGSLLNWGNVKLPNELPDINLRLTKDNKYEFWWNKSKYYNALDEFQYSLKYGNYQSTKDTFLTTNSKFGDPFEIYLYSIPKHKTKSYLEGSKNNYQKNLYKYFGEKAPIPWYIFQPKFIEKDVYIYIENDSVNKIQLSNGNKISQSIIIENRNVGPGTADFSPQGKFILGYYNPGNNDFIHFAKNLETNEIHTLKNYKNLIKNTSQPFAISDNGIGIAVDHSNYCEYLFDFTQDAPIKTNCEKNNTLTTNVKISSNGQYYLRNNISSLQVLKSEETSGIKTLHNLNTWNSFVEYWEFNPLNSNQFVISDNKNISIYQCEPAILTKKIELSPDEELMNVDFFNNEYLTYKPGKITVKSFPESEVLFELEVNVKYEYILHNRMILFKNGDYYMYRIK